jgi:hypothetical protein
VTPLFNDPKLGSVIWGVKSNWSILKNISMLRAHLKPGVARDAIWYPDAGTLYIVSKGTGQFNIVLAGHKPQPFEVKMYDYIFIPAGVFIPSSTHRQKILKSPHFLLRQIHNRKYLCQSLLHSFQMRCVKLQ